MMQAGRSLRTWAMAMAAGLVAAPAEAAPDVAAWLAANTDMTAAQVVIAGPDRVYSLEPLGASTSAGEIVVLVRAETIAKGANGFASWDAHLLFDCLGGRLRAIRSAAYPRQNRKGAPRAEAASEDWTRPEAPEPAAQLLAAACDPAFAWPLRTAKAPAPPQTMSPPIPTARTYAVQIARGPSQEGAQRALKAARKTLGASADGLTATTELSHVGSRRRYTALLSGFPSADAATRACATLTAAGQACFTRRQGDDAG